MAAPGGLSAKGRAGAHRRTGNKRGQRPKKQASETNGGHMKNQHVRQVKLPAEPRLAWASVLVPGSVIVTVWAWQVLGWHARGMLLAAWSVAVALVLLRPALRTRARLKAGVSAQGTVVGAEKRISSTGIGTWAPTFVPNTLYHARVRFTTRDGRTVVFTSPLGSPDSDLELGRPVPVRYRSEDPEQAQVDTPLAWVVPTALGFLGGLGQLVAGVVVYLQA